MRKPVVVESVIERMDRWAESPALKDSDDIPLGSEEQYEFLMMLQDQQFYDERSTSSERVLECLRKGELKFKGHKVVVL